MAYLGKIILGAGIGVLAVAAAPFTGGGSVAGGISLAASLAGTGTVVAAAGTAVVGATAGAFAESVNEDLEFERIKKAKETSYEDGTKEGLYLSVEEIKKRDDFCFATTALSYYVARCDGTIHPLEEAEIAMDLDAIFKNADLPNAVQSKIEEIKNNKYITFEDVKNYLDKVSIKTLRKLATDVAEIIEADEIINAEELAAQAEFEAYLQWREAHE